MALEFQLSDSSTDFIFYSSQSKWNPLTFWEVASLQVFSFSRTKIALIVLTLDLDFLFSFFFMCRYFMKQIMHLTLLCVM